MKTIEEGHLEGLVRIVCEDCGTVYESSRVRDISYWKQGQDLPMHECPVCHKKVCDKTLALLQLEANIKVAEMDSTAEARRKANRWWNKLRKKKKEGK